ncbi:SRPBCC family protein [Nocardioides donggukensis]|uniref:SRPBCC family protein n=1 Tax=Nocardioides donggukensis TaxID=2774019 RepID=UPI00191DDBF9|nr:SRPBCC family protein [Nocardioides donggukensis]
MSATPEQVWAVLADGWLYPLWVVGASRMREVDAHWPEVGAHLSHSVGAWPLLVDDSTEVTECVPGVRLGLRARAWPSGEAGVTIHMTAVGAETEVRIEEDAVSGPGRLVPPPLRHLPLAWRNVETLRRLAYVAERR